jgi:holo-[acyl-carrier protein] synthase
MPKSHEKNLMNNLSFSNGIDIENPKRFEREHYSWDDPFFQKVFTRKELEYCFLRSDPSVHLAGKFACKEAAYKALSQAGFHISDISVIEVLNDKRNIPFIICEEIDLNKVKIAISISHTADLAISSAVVWYI